MSAKSLSYQTLSQLLNRVELIELMQTALFDEYAEQGASVHSIVSGRELYLEAGFANLDYEAENDFETISVFDSQTNDLLLSLNAASVAAIRAGVCAAIATNILAPKSIRRMAVLGTGTRVREYLMSLQHFRSIKELLVFDMNPFASGRFCAEMARQINGNLVAVNSLTEGLFEADVLLSQLVTDYPIIYQDMHDAVYLCSLIDDQYGIEFAPDVYANARVFCNDAANAKESLSDLQSALRGIEATNLQTLVHEKPNTQEESELSSLYLSTSSKWQDMIVARYFYERFTATSDFS